jgi:hypothetical protein
MTEEATSPAVEAGPEVLMVSISRESLRRMYDALMDACEDGMTHHAECMMEAARVLAASLPAPGDK